MADDRYLEELEEEMAEMGSPQSLVGTERVEKKVGSVSQLDLSGLSLKQLPSTVLKFTKIRQLYLSDNQLSSLPADFSTLTSLKHLGLNNNNFENFPRSILQLKNLKILNFENNDLRSLPFELIYLELEFLLVSNNQRLGFYSTQYSYFTPFRFGWEPGDPWPMSLNTLYKHLVLEEAKRYLYDGRSLDELIQKIEKVQGANKDGLKEPLIKAISDPKQLLVMRLTESEFYTTIKKRYTKVKESNPIMEELEVLVGETIPHYDRLPTDSLGYTTYQNRLITGISLPNTELEQFPIRLVQFASLNSLILDNNYIEYLPTEVDKMSSLSVLSMQSNQLHNLPPELMNLDALEYLILTGNNLRNISTDFSNLSNLRVLVLDSCNLSTLPKGINGIPNLEELVISHNPGLSLGQELEQLDSLRVLRLANVGLAKLPFELEKMGNLQHLDLSNNDFETVPSAITSISHKVMINFRNNPITPD